jgi:hypothetical protein
MTISPTYPTHHLSYDLAEATAGFRRRPFVVSHRLADHELFSIEALADLADRLPEGVSEHNLGSVGAVEPGGDVPKLDLRLSDVVRGIETNNSWVALPLVLKHPPLSGIPGYQDLVDGVFEDLAPMVPGGRAAMSGFHAVVFLASRSATTPSHVDGEIGFLLHVRGQKRISIGRFADSRLEQEELEAFHRNEHRNTRELPVDVEHYDLEPGTGVHVPPLTPHWVENGNDVAISLSVGFQTPENIRRAGVYMWNARVRRLGLSPRPYGVSPARDRVKASLLWQGVDARRRVLRRMRGSASS